MKRAIVHVSVTVLFRQEDTDSAERTARESHDSETQVGSGKKGGLTGITAFLLLIIKLTVWSSHLLL